MAINTIWCSFRFSNIQIISKFAKTFQVERKRNQFNIINSMKKIFVILLAASLCCVACKNQPKAEEAAVEATEECCQKAEGECCGKCQKDSTCAQCAEHAAEAAAAEAAE